MIVGLLILSIALTGIVFSLCVLQYLQQKKLFLQLGRQQEMQSNLDIKLQHLLDQQVATYKRIDQLAIDVLQREIYQTADDRHQLAVKSAKEGQSLYELMQLHGLSSDEAALIMSLHAPKDIAEDPSIKNANISNPTVLDVI